ncbi:Gfo/Idh/MocA family oxidoreductase [candidate division KSB1 bacterium]|nr:Gfo/Idh/MocA family oxidoreductase [candidate division KSB1 bacterium]
MIFNTKKAPKEILVLMVGIGGYGFYYFLTLLDEFPKGKVKLAGIVDPYVKQSPIYDRIAKLDIPVFSEIKDFYENGLAADLAVISSPIHFHVPQSIIALKNGTNVLCEKPISATVQETDELIRAKNESGKWVSIGYQWFYSKAIQSLKNDIKKGLFGKPIRLKTLVLWPRDDSYYNRNNWAGRIKDDSGSWILDSPANNAAAHFLFNMLFLLGDETESSAIPKELLAECYHANPIKNYDTIACRIFAHDEVELLFYTSHATKKKMGPVFEFKFEDGIVRFGGAFKEIVATDNKGNKKYYGSPDDCPQFLKLFRAVDACSNPEPVLCGLEAARAHTVCVNGIQESTVEINTFPKSIINRDEKNNRWWVTGLDKILMDCYENNRLPSEGKISWATEGRMVDLVDYNFFPVKKPKIRED